MGAAEPKGAALLLPDAIFCLYIIAVGFVLAGLSASLHQLVTGRPLRFEFASARAFAIILGLPLRAFAGPAILMRNAIKGALLGRPPYWLALSTIIASLWSFFSGVLLIELLLRFGFLAFT